MFGAVRSGQSIPLFLQSQGLEVGYHRLDLTCFLNCNIEKGTL